MERVLVICPNDTDIRELELGSFAKEYELYFAHYPTDNLVPIISGKVGFLGYDFDPAQTVSYLVEFVKKHAIDAVFASDDYPGSILAAIVAKECGLIGPNPETVITHHHKFYSRCFQEQSVPEATPRFGLVGDGKKNPEGLAYPFFVKPVKCSFSRFAQEVHSAQELASAMQASIPDAYIAIFNWFVERYTTAPSIRESFLAEELLVGEQCTLEGFMHKGTLHQLGIVDSIFFPGTLSFKRFDYPSKLSHDVQGRMAHISETLLNHTQFGDGFFNIEFMYDPEKDRISIIEVNPRMVHQFADMFEKVDGINTYEYMLQFITNKPVSVKKGKGPYSHASLCVMREFEKKRVCRVPTKQEVQEFKKQFPDARYTCYAPKEGTASTDRQQDGNSLRYGIITFGGESIADIEDKFEQSKQILRYEFEPA